MINLEEKFHLCYPGRSNFEDEEKQMIRRKQEMVMVVCVLCR